MFPANLNGVGIFFNEKKTGGGPNFGPLVGWLVVWLIGRVIGCCVIAWETKHEVVH